MAKEVREYFDPIRQKGLDRYANQPVVNFDYANLYNHVQLVHNIKPSFKLCAKRVDNIIKKISII